MKNPDDTNGQHPFPPVQDRPIRLAVLISGGGTTMLNFQDQIRNGSLNAEIVLVVASRSGCAGVSRAQDAGLNCQVIRPRDHDGVDAYSGHVFQEIRAANADVVALAGFLSLLKIPDDFHHRVLNIHPSLIPSFCGQGFYGHHVHEAAIRRGVKVSGCTVHFADNHYDEGPIILQQVVSVPDGCDADELASVVFDAEKEAYPEAIRLLADGRVRLSRGRTSID